MIFLIVITICSNSAINDQNRLKTMINHKKTQEYLLAESAVINEIRCMGRQGISEGSFSVQAVRFELYEKDGQLYATVLSPVQETMIIELDEDGLVSDYESIR